jgi:hypothetical protein
MGDGLDAVGVEFGDGPGIATEIVEQAAGQPAGSYQGCRRGRGTKVAHRGPATVLTSSPIPVISMLTLSPGSR